MRVAFLVYDLSPSGGVATILSHARQLTERGHEVDLLQPGDEPAAEYDWAVATWWETAARLWHVRARRRLVFLQSFEERFYGPGEQLERQGAAAVLDLPVDYVVVAGWMRDALAELRPDAGCVVVHNGIDKGVFAARERRDHAGPLRILVEGQPTLWFKAVPDSLAAAAAMTEPRHVTVASLEPGEVPGADRVVGGLDPAGMAGLYAESDVLLKLSRVEGLPLPPLEGFHMGLPCVVTPYGGHADCVDHGHNGLVVGFDDIPGTARWLDALARDRALLGKLSGGALATAAGWPSAEQAGQAFATALEELDERPAPDPALAPGRLLRRMRFTQAFGGVERGELQDRLEETRRELAHAQTLVHELSVKAASRRPGLVRRIAARLRG